jgi:hypothetical protein
VSASLQSGKYMLRKLMLARVRRRVFLERLTEPLHLNAIAAAVWAFGSYRDRIAFDLVVRPQHAFGILRAADEAKRIGIRRVTLIEFGVASGAGIMNMAYIAERVSRETGVRFDLYGFDTGEGMPPPADHRDHPEYYQAGDFQMDAVALRAALPDSVHLVLGDLRDTVPQFLAERTEEAPIGFVAVDVDYYWSTVAALRVLAANPCLYLPLTTTYFDDVVLDNHNSWQGQQLAIREFNEANAMRKLEHHRFLENQRVFRNALWLKQIYSLHVMDHPARSTVAMNRGVQRHLENAYLGTSRRREQV